MPQNGETPIGRFARAVAGEHGFVFGAPSVSDDGLAVAVPLLRSEARSKRFVLPAECRDALSAVDTGRLDRIRVRNDASNRVFLPPGTLFKGRHTPSRGTTVGAVVDAGCVSDLGVKCVHPSQPVEAGATLAPLAILAPGTVTEALLTQDQGLVWTLVGAVTTSRDGAPGPTTPGTDDLLASLAPPRSRTGGLDGTQCGEIVLDHHGVLEVEVFDHPDSWKAAPRAAIAEPSDRVGSGRLALRTDGAIELAKEFVRRLGEMRYHRTGTASWIADDGTVAFMTFDDEVIHLIAFGRSVVVPERPALAPTPLESLPAAASEGAWSPGPVGFPEADDAGAGTTAVATTQAAEDSESRAPAERSRRRKILTSGWDPATLGSLERYVGKEFGGDRSAAIRFLVRRELRGRGYMGPLPSPSPSHLELGWEPAEPEPRLETGRAAMEAKILDLGRIVQTDAYASWLRQRARSEMERIATTAADDLLQAAAQTALDRLPAPASAEEELPGSIEEEIPPTPSPPLRPVDVRPLLRRAFAASAGGQYPEALALFDDVLLAEPDNRTALLGRAVALRRSGKTQEALEGLDLVLQKEPTNAAALLNRGRILQERGDFQGALESIDALARAAPNDWDVWMVRGDLLVRMGRDREAREAYSEALRRNPEDEELLAKIHTLEKVQPAPAPTPLQRAPLPREVQEGQSYLVKERRPDLSLRVLRALLLRTVPAMLITPRSADAVRRESGLAGIRPLELSHTPGEGHHDPTALAALTNVVERFIRENHLHGVIVLEGLASLILENGFRETALFIERIHETILQSHALFLVSVTPGDLEDRELALLERSLKVLS